MTTVNSIVTGTKSKKSTIAKRRLLKFVDKINLELESYFEGEIKTPFGVSREEKLISKDILSHIKEHCLRPAKRLRGSFVFYGYKLLNGKGAKQILNASMSIELIHTSLLIHDDFMDQDSTRRGLPTTHEHYKNLHQTLNYKHDPVHYGDSMAVNAGDMALMAGFEILGRSNFEASLKLSAINRLLRGIYNTAIGQSYDITLEVMGRAKESDIINLHHAKTAIYTYENPLHIGAILAGANQKDLNLLSEYAIPGGIAFQLQDDILGLYGDPKRTGKPAHSDLRQGKMTLLIIKALKNASPRQKKDLLGVWGKRDITNSDAKIARDIVRETGSLNYSKDISINYARKAQRSIPKMIQRGWNKKAIDYMDGIAQYMVERDM